LAGDQLADEQVADADPSNMVPVIRTKTIRISNKKVASLDIKRPIPSEELTRSVKIEAKADKVDSLTTASTGEKGWVIQVGAAPGKAEAMSLLQKAQDKGGKVLRSATPFTVAFAKGNEQLYRARFGGFRDQDAAVNACKTLKRKGVSCWASLQ
jgi:D-alanyl-D-alanine carboxypeptidase